MMLYVENKRRDNNDEDKKFIGGSLRMTGTTKNEDGTIHIASFF